MQNVEALGNRSKIARMGTFSAISVTGACTKTRGGTLTRERRWEGWFDVDNEAKLVFRVR